ncbi:MAG: FHA domain-containing protein [Saprospiraceae bacterium]|nr:FHA domain-containing protein [Candidatus Brachybacter algidus]
MERRKDPTNEIVYDNKPISLFHCKVEITGKDHITIIDNNSNNGTWVNGVRIQRKNITRSDKLTLGTVEVNFRRFLQQIK